MSSSNWRMSAPATKLAVPWPVKTTAATSSRRDRCSTTTVNSSSARSFSAFTGGLVTDSELAEAPRHPLTVRKHGDTLEIIGMGTRENNIFPGHIEGEIGHFAQIKQEINRPFELDLVVNNILKLTVVCKRKFGVDTDFNALRLVLGNNHFSLPVGFEAWWSV